MPMYEYECPVCKTITEIEQSIKETILAEVPCADCGQMAKKIISKRNAFILRGEGWPSRDLKKGVNQ